jgi:hypothetical protein
MFSRIAFLGAMSARSETNASVEELATANISYLEAVIQRLERLLAHKRAVAAALLSPGAVTGQTTTQA